MYFNHQAVASPFHCSLPDHMEGLEKQYENVQLDAFVWTTNGIVQSVLLFRVVVY